MSNNDIVFSKNYKYPSQIIPIGIGKEWKEPTSSELINQYSQVYIYLKYLDPSFLPINAAQRSLHQM